MPMMKIAEEEKQQHNAFANHNVKDMSGTIWSMQKVFYLQTCRIWNVWTYLTQKGIVVEESDILRQQEIECQLLAHLDILSLQLEFLCCRPKYCKEKMPLNILFDSAKNTKQILNQGNHNEFSLYISMPVTEKWS